MAYEPINLGDILAQTGQIKAQQQKGQMNALALQEAQKSQADQQGIDSALVSNPNANLGDLIKAGGGMAGVKASADVGAARNADLTNHYRQTYTAATQVANSDNPLQTIQQVAPQFPQQYDSVHGQGAFAQMSQDPSKLKAAAAQVAQDSLAGLVDPDKQFQAHQTDIENHYKQEGPGGELARNQNTIAGENARTKYVQGQENARNKATIDATNSRSGFNADGTLNSKFDSQVQAILDYRAAPYSGVSMRSGPGAAIMAEVNRRDPTYDTSQYPAKAAALKSLTSGKDGQTLDQVNTAVQHLSQLKGLLAALNTGQVNVINQARQAFQAATGNSAPTDARVVANMAAGEVNKVVTGGPGAEGDRDISRAATQLTGSPEQQQGAMDNIIGLMAGRLNSVGNRFKQAKLGPQFDNMLLPETKAALAQHGYSGPDGAPQTAAATVPTATGPNGKKLYLRNGQWSPQ